MIQTGYLSLNSKGSRNHTRGLGDVTSALIGGGISAGVQLATSAAALWLNSIQQSHNADTITTLDVNKLASLLQDNVNAYLAGPGTCADQAAALAAYQSGVEWLQGPSGCGAPNLGSAGNRCISDRFGDSAKWPWKSYYYDPIANDPRAAGCASNTLINNPNAGVESAVSNLNNFASGSNVMTSPGEFVSSPVSGSNVNIIASGSPTSAINSSSDLVIGGFDLTQDWPIVVGVIGIGIAAISILGEL